MDTKTDKTLATLKEKFDRGDYVVNKEHHENMIKKLESFNTKIKQTLKR